MKSKINDFGLFLQTRYAKIFKKRGDIMTTKTNDLILMVESLPVDIKTKLVEKILNSLHPSQREIDELWAKEAEKRVKEIRTGKVKTIPGEEVFKEIKKKFSK
ncbi:MAG: addiction module protein [Nitrospirota bacterium]